MMNRNGYDESLMDMIHIFQVVKPSARTSCKTKILPFCGDGCVPRIPTGSTGPCVDPGPLELAC